jgi:hypothetical protein
VKGTIHSASTEWHSVKANISSVWTEWNSVKGKFYSVFTELNDFGDVGRTSFASIGMTCVEMEGIGGRSRHFGALARDPAL